MIKTKRVYEPTEKGDGKRYLVDQLWPRGLSKEAVQVESWAKEVAPSNALRRWFAHDPDRWEEFQRRYDAELRDKPETWEPLLQAAQDGNLTLVYGARDTEHNNAVALARFLQKQVGTLRPSQPASRAGGSHARKK